MMFGNPATFGIEIFDEGESQEWRGFGRMCLHLAGHTLGDLSDSHCSLWHPVERIEEVARDLPHLWSRAFDGCTDMELFVRLDELLYSGEPPEDRPSYEAHDFLTGTGEMFDDEKSFVFCDTSGVVRVVWQGRDDRICAAHFPRAEFEMVAAELSRWFDGVRQARRAGV